MRCQHDKLKRALQHARSPGGFAFSEPKAEKGKRRMNKVGTTAYSIGGGTEV
jgi:hypothetical protein